MFFPYALQLLVSAASPRQTNSLRELPLLLCSYFSLMLCLACGIVELFSQEMRRRE